MGKDLRLMCVLAHPDDESLGTGGLLAKYAAEGVETYLVTATRGERGWFGPREEYPGPGALGEIREGELRQAAAKLGVKEVQFLDYIDGELGQADAGEAVARIVDQLRRVRPQVVVTFDPFGVYGHPDHVAISQYTSAALVAAADRGYQTGTGQDPCRVQKLYYFVETLSKVVEFESIFGDISMQVGDQVRTLQPWPEWAVTTRVDTADHGDTVWAAIRCHQSQLPGFEQIQQLPADRRRELWRVQTLYRAYSLVNHSREVERDVFQGLRG